MSGGWYLVPIPGLGAHLIPADDTHEHMDQDCPCKPVLMTVGPGSWWEHNSFDGREAFEEGERKVS